MHQGHSKSFVSKLTGIKKILPLIATMAFVVLVTLAFARAQSPFNSVEVAFTDTSAHGMQIVPASCPSNPFDASAPYGCGGSIPLCANGITPAPNGNLSQCTCADNGGSGPNCTPTPPIVTDPGPGGNPGGGAGGGSCNPGYTYEGAAGCIFTGCPTGYSQGTDANGNPQCNFVACPTGYVMQMQQGHQMCIQNQCVQGNVCGADGNLYYEDQSCKETFVQTCAYGCVANNCFVPVPKADIMAVPIVVKSGETSKISWAAENVQSCTISANNGDSWSCSGNACAATTTKQSLPISSQTTYNLNCTGLDKSTVTGAATIDVVPNFVEH